MNELGPSVEPSLAIPAGAGNSPDQNLYELFAEQARANPGAVAIVHDQGETTYGWLAARAEAVAAFLATRRLAPEQPVGVLMHRTAELVAVLLGILRAGGSYVPLDPDDPPDRNRRIFEVSRCGLVLGHRDLIDSLQRSLAISHRAGEKDAEFWGVDQIPSTAETDPADVAPGGSRLAYVLFTSGSTGDPKGVEIEHRSVVNLLLAVRDLLSFTATDRFLAVSTIGFDISVAEIFLPLITGGSLLLRDRRILMNPRALAADVVQHGVTVVQTGPSLWSLVLNEVPDFPRVRVLITTSEAVSPELAGRLAALGAQVWNLYGPTEATIWATGHRLSAGEPGDGDSTISASIGRPLAGAEVLILGEDGQPASPGTVGELCLGGPGLARGYRDNPELTRERFRHHGFSGARWYHTGDLAAWTPSGELQYFGRNDDQLKIRGVRIEPREVESAILTHPGVRETAATWYPTPSGPRSIVAAVVPREGAGPSPAKLHAWLESRLSGPMIPSRFVVCQALPMTPSGKVDRVEIRRRALESSSNSPAETGSRAPTRTEETVIIIWKRLLGVPTVAVTDHFFSIGGDSLAAARMMVAMEAVFGLVLPVQLAFEAPTVEQLAARIEQAGRSPGERRGSPFIFPLAPAASGRPLYFSEVDLRLAGRGRWQVPGPLYSISYWSQGNGFARAASLPELARSHVAAIRALQPRGPYRLAGFSFGALIALEIAQQLKRDGQHVELLFLLDPLQPFHTDQGPTPDQPGAVARPPDETLFQRIARHGGALARRPTHALPYLWEKLFGRLWIVGVNQWLAYKIVDRHGRRPNWITERLLPKDRWPAFWYAAHRLAHAYVARPYDGPVLAVFPARDDRYRTWARLIGSDRDFHVIPASHNVQFVDPALGQWMQHLAARLLT